MGLQFSVSYAADWALKMGAGFGRAEDQCHMMNISCFYLSFSALQRIANLQKVAVFHTTASEGQGVFLQYFIQWKGVSQCLLHNCFQDYKVCYTISFMCVLMAGDVMSLLMGRISIQS